MTVVINVPVVASGDDGTHRSGASHAVNTNTGFIQMGFVTGAENIASFTRFQNVALPKRAKIKNAFLSLYGRVTQSNGAVNGYIDGLAHDNAPAVTHAQFDGLTSGNAGDDHGRATPASAVPRTTAKVPWFGVPGVTATVTDQSPNCAPVIGEIVRRPGWASGNALTLFFGDEDFETVPQSGDVRRIYNSWDDNASMTPPNLTVYYVPRKRWLLLTRTL